jgi:hypothetical protein
MSNELQTLIVVWGLSLLNLILFLNVLRYAAQHI